MIVLLQRVKESSVRIKDENICHIQDGILVFLGVASDDEIEDCEYLVKKILKLRIFDDDRGKMNLSCEDIKGEILVVSQFTLLADTKKGNRPSYSLAARPEVALRLYNCFVGLLKKSNLSVKTGQFAEHMQVSLVNEGPVTIILDSKKRSL